MDRISEDPNSKKLVKDDSFEDDLPKDLTNPEEIQKEMSGIVPNDGNQNIICKAKEASIPNPRTVNVLGNDNINFLADIEKKDEADV